MIRTRRRSGLRDDNGAAAVEFALVAPLFLALIFSIMEAGWFFFVSSTTERANEEAARLIRTGQAQDGLSASDLFGRVCAVVKAFGECSETLGLDVTSFPDFASLAAAPAGADCPDPDALGAGNIQYTAADFGDARDIVRVSLCLRYKPINPAIGLKLDRDETGSRRIRAETVFRNEPFGGA